ncbi:hypothetical protein [Hymenobacter psychrotolerans]|uniref:YXWGXW repeat-containing protein n=1 Tax=Hymenobacter psychrotolerans DSM 18569 TaxID=1121959 RepID=A0A1M6PTR2_9BACT|nr:hypothetical protein [Hymenobacter psychrotolerans]SHK11302.1 hypothetical protein SAMN02746009_00339 [Hymenobacter psychrotolerans DSM 18569]
MKNFLPTLLPALSLLALGGCAGTAAISSTENDGVYYSSQDRTTQNARPVASRSSAAETTTGDELTNPDYAGEGSASASSGGTEYYDEGYTYSSRIRRFHQPYYRGFGYGYNDFIYADPFWYGGPGYYSAWGPSYYGGYDPFWGPSFYGGSYVNINIGFGWGRPWGWNRWGGGYGRGFYDGYYSGLYGGGYGGYGYGGYGSYYGAGGYGVVGGGGTVRNVRYGPRSGRSAEATSTGRANTATSTPGGRGRVNQGGVVAPGGTTAPTGGVVGSTPAPTTRGNIRSAEAVPGATEKPAVRGSRDMQVADQAPGAGSPTQKAPNTRYQPQQDAAATGDATAPGRAGGEGRRWRVAPDAATGSQSAPASSDYSQPRRSRSIFTPSTPQSGGGQTADQPVRRQRTFEAPAQRSYEQPSRSFEQPSRSYSPPANMGGGGGRSSGGGGGGGRGRVN